MSSRVPNGSGDLAASVNASSHGGGSSDLAALFNYPSLGRLFESPDSPALAEMRARLERTRQSVERVIRQGGDEDALRAARVTRAYVVTLDLLDNLTRLQRDGAK